MQSNQLTDQYADTCLIVYFVKPRFRIEVQDHYSYHRECWPALHNKDIHSIDMQFGGTSHNIPGFSSFEATVQAQVLTDRPALSLLMANVALLVNVCGASTLTVRVIVQQFETCSRIHFEVNELNQAQ